MARVRFRSGRSEAQRPLLYLVPILICITMSIPAEGLHPLSAKASLLRFWRRELPNVTLPAFLLHKASPLNATSMAVFSSLLEHNSLAPRITSFCAAADLLCARRAYAYSTAVSGSDSLNREFEIYHGSNFKRYKVNGSLQNDSFTSYSRDDNVNGDKFGNYGAGGNVASQQFLHYADNINVGDESFKKYGEGSNAGTRSFTTYGEEANEPTNQFKTYATNSNADTQSFTSYGDNANVVNNDFRAYSKEANGIQTEFTNYAKSANVINNTFGNYDIGGNGPQEGFTNYASDSNVPLNQFQRYASDGNGATETFTNYGDGANVGTDSFKTYGKGGNAPTIVFTNYGNGSFPSADTFTNYAQDSNGPNITFKSYALPSTVFKQYFKKDDTSFSQYAGNSSSSSSSSSSVHATGVEPGKFFRESKLKSGTEMPLPDLKDYMVPRSFLPRSLADKFPVTSASLPGLLKLFQIPQNSSMERMMRDTVYDCERAPAKGETKRCVTSVEGMAEFAKQVLGPRLQVMTTASTRGSRHNVIMGAISRAAGGAVTRSVSCHQSMFPFLMYYCHSVPQVRVYEADMLSSSSGNSSSRGQGQEQDQNNKSKSNIINHGVGICHLDTSVWSPKHAAFRALGGQPGGIEVCHWIFEDDLIWVPTSAA